MAKVRKSVADKARAAGAEVKDLNSQVRSLVQRQTKRIIQDTVRETISTVSNSGWMGVGQPLTPQAPADSGTRIFDYPLSYNVDYRPRKHTAYTFQQLQWLADNFDLLRECIERRKDELTTVKWDVVSADGDDIEDDPDVDRIRQLIQYPSGDKTQPWPVWTRNQLEDMFIGDCSSVEPRFARDGSLLKLDIVSGATITPLIDDTGRKPEPPDPAYLQVIHGIPYRFFTKSGQLNLNPEGTRAVNPRQTKDQAPVFSKRDLIYFPRNLRPKDPVYGFSQVEQLVMTIAIGIKAEQRHYYFYTEGTIPESMIGVPDSWSAKQIASFQAYFDSIMTGNLKRRAGVTFLPGDMKNIAMKDYKFDKDMWEWLARMCCAVMHVSPQPYSQMMNRATSGTAQVMQIEEGLEPDKDWIEAFWNLVISEYCGRPDLRFRWDEDDQVDVLEQARADDLSIRNGSKSIERVMLERGDQPYPNGVGSKPIFVTTAGPVLLEQIEEASEKAVAPAPTPVVANGKPNGAPKQPKPVAEGARKFVKVDAQNWREVM